MHEGLHRDAGAKRLAQLQIKYILIICFCTFAYLSEKWRHLSVRKLISSSVTLHFPCVGTAVPYGFGWLTKMASQTYAILCSRCCFMVCWFCCEDDKGWGESLVNNFQLFRIQLASMRRLSAIRSAARWQPQYSQNQRVC